MAEPRPGQSNGSNFKAGEKHQADNTLLTSDAKYAINHTSMGIPPRSRIYSRMVEAAIKTGGIPDRDTVERTLTRRKAYTHYRRERVREALDREFGDDYDAVVASAAAFAKEIVRRRYSPRRAYHQARRTTLPSVVDIVIPFSSRNSNLDVKPERVIKEGTFNLVDQLSKEDGAKLAGLFKVADQSQLIQGLNRAELRRRLIDINRFPSIGESTQEPPESKPFYLGIVDADKIFLHGSRIVLRENERLILNTLLLLRDCPVTVGQLESVFGEDVMSAFKTLKKKVNSPRGKKLFKLEELPSGEWIAINPRARIMDMRSADKLGTPVKVFL